MNCHYYRKPKQDKQYKGVFRIKNCYGKEYIIAKIVYRGETFYLGSFSTEIKAAQEYNRFAKILFKENAFLNKLPQN